MMRSFSRTIFLACVIMLIASALYAGGSVEKLPPEVSDLDLPFDSISELMGQAPPTTSGGFLYSLASVYDEITAAFCLALTPFPNTLVSFYGGYGTNSYKLDQKLAEMSLSNSLLIGDDYYSGSNGVLTYGTREYPGKTADRQKQIWNMITGLFIAFLLAEIVFTAIYHYVSDKDGSVLKEILAKVVMSIAIFLIASSLPFLIEMFRTGFVAGAAMLTGIDDQITDATEKVPTTTVASTEELLKSPGKISTKAITSLVEMRSLPVFNYPGILIRSVSDVFGFMDPDNVGGTGISLNDKVDDDYNWIVQSIVKFLMNLVYLAVKLVASIMVLIAALHILYNVCEVYLLLGCVMLLLPFTIFSPLKFLGEKAVMSLFANVLELFVIVMIMFSTLSIAYTVTNGLLSNVLANVKSISIDMTVSNVDKLADYITTKTGRPQETTLDWLMGVREKDKDGNLGALRLTVMLPGPDGVNGYESLSGMIKPQNGAPAIGDTLNTLTYVATWISEQWDSAIKELETSEDGKNTIYEKTKTLKYAYDTMGYPADKYLSVVSAAGFAELPATDKLAVVTYIAGTEAGSQFGMTVSDTATYDRGFDPRVGAMDLYFMHLVSFIVIILMQTYFVNQSSQITNALLSGNVSSEGFTGALTRMAGGAALKGMGKAAAMPVKALGSAGGTALGMFGTSAAHQNTRAGAAARFFAGEHGTNTAERIRGMGLQNGQHGGNP